eukprot:5704791-Pyramimonas_sp.AAC.1
MFSRRCAIAFSSVADSPPCPCEPSVSRSFGRSWPGGPKRRGAGQGGIGVASTEVSDGVGNLGCLSQSEDGY